MLIGGEFAREEIIKRLLKIEFEKDWVYKPRYTNSFLLHNAKSTFELFNIRSEVDYRLVYELRRIQENIKVQDNDSELFVKINDSISVYNDGVFIRVFNSGEEVLRKSTMTFANTPSVVFEEMRALL